MRNEVCSICGKDLDEHCVQLDDGTICMKCWKDAGHIGPFESSIIATSQSIDDLIDDMYPPFEMFGVKFYPCEIIKRMDEMLYDQIREDILSDWVEDTIHQLERFEPEVGDTMEELLLEPRMSGLEMIVWKEEE